MSSRTMSSMGISDFSPSRSTLALAAVRKLKRSMERLARISWMMPMAVLAATMAMNRVSFTEPTARIAAKMRMFTRLNSVQMLRSTICFSVRVAGVESKFCCPASTRSRTCCALRPRLGSGCTRATSRRSGRGGVLAFPVVVVLSFFFAICRFPLPLSNDKNG